MKSIPVILIILSLLTACQKNSLIPEITPDLNSKPIHKLKGKHSISQLAQFNAGLIFITPKNEIKIFDLDTKNLDTLFQLKLKVAESFPVDDHRLIVKNKEGTEWSVLDLKKKTILTTVKDAPIDKIIGCKNNLICFQRDQKILIFDYQSRSLIQEIPLEAEDVFNCAFKGSDVIILSSKKLYVYTQAGNRLNSYILTNEPGSGFLLWDNYIYYGSTNRELLKISLKTRRVKWKVKLAMPLHITPQRMGKHIVISPQDNNIFFFNRNGTLHWWEKLEATRMLPPILMKENVAVFLLERKVKFINPKTKKAEKFSLKTGLDSNPVYIDKNLYYFSHEKKKTVRLLNRLGNIYQVKIITDPKNVKPLGQSIQFYFEPINLVKPVLDIKILDEKEQAIFQKTLTHTDSMSFVWIPEKSGKYSMTLDIKSKNREQISITKSMTVSDIEKIIQGIHQKIIRDCPIDLFKSPSASQ
jgi:outer membrane protein assembly factor BamB